MKVLAYMILHTGKPYIAAAVESIINQVDRLIIFYTPTPSQGFEADIPCPDTEDELLREVAPWLHKIDWVKGSWKNETEHVNAVNAYSAEYDWVWRLDADEVSPPGMIAEMVRQAEATTAREFRIPFVHFWRAFSRCCRDGSQPIRLMKPTGDGIVTLDSKDQTWEVFHFGYAQPTLYIIYKTFVSGHRPEWRPDWFQDRWLANAQRDVHPVMYPHHWHAEPYDKEKMPEVLKRHKYFNMAVIE